jgi:hypothetical protein
MAGMKLYADIPSTLLRQLVTDALFVVWLVAWVAIGVTIHDGTLALAEPGERLESSAGSLGDSMTEAADVLGDTPVVGDEAAAPFEKAAGAAETLADAGRSEVEAVESLAFWLGVSIALIPILVVTAFYLPGRIRFVREATAGQRFIDSSADEDLFALRAMAHQPMHLLARISDEPVAAWRRGDDDVVRALAALEMRSVGLQPRR